MRPTLGRRHGVNLVDDHRLDVAQNLARLRRKNQIQRFRRRDEDVGRMPHNLAPVGGAGVPRAHRHGRQVESDALALSDGLNPHQGRPQIAIDVHRQRLQRRNINNAHPALRLASLFPPSSMRGQWLRFRRRVTEQAAGRIAPKHQPVNRRQKRRQRLARACRRQQQRTLPLGQHRPSSAAESSSASPAHRRTTGACTSARPPSPARQPRSAKSAHPHPVVP